MTSKHTILSLKKAMNNINDSLMEGNDECELPHYMA